MTTSACIIAFYRDKKAESRKVSRFNGDHEEFSWWKTNFYIYVMGLDEELWDILEDGVGDLVLDEEGAAIDRKKHNPQQKKLYKKHHKIRGSLVTAIPKAEYMELLCLFISMSCSRWKRM